MEINLFYQDTAKVLMLPKALDLVSIIQTNHNRNSPK